MLSLRKIVSLTTMFSFIAMSITGIILFVEPQGRVADWVELRIAGLSKGQWGDLHITFSLLFLIAGILHIYLNWSAIMLYLKNKAKKIVVFTPNFIISLLITLIFFFGTYYKITPFIDIILFGSDIKDRWAEKYGNPPFGHAELVALTGVCKKMDLDLKKAMSLLKDAGIKYNSPDETLQQIARNNNISPSMIYKIIEKAEIPLDEPEQVNEEKKSKDAEKKEQNSNDRNKDKSPASKSENTKIENVPMGLGKLSLEDVCKQQKIDLNKAIETLKKEGFNTTPDITLKQIANQKGVMPRDVFELISK